MGQNVILWHALVLAIPESQVVLGRRIPQFRGKAKPAYRFLIVLRHPLAFGILEPQFDLGLRIPPFRREAKPPHRLLIVLRQPPPGLLHHPDRGSQYASHAYQTLLQRHKMRVSMSRIGNCWDHTVVERVFGSLKGEGLPEQPAATQVIAKADTVDYLEMLDNSHRHHSTLGYLSPNAFEAQAQRGERPRQVN